MASLYDPIEDIEQALDHLEEYDRFTQVQLLHQEVQHYLEHGTQPTKEWFIQRYRYISMYAELHWLHMYYTLHDKNTFIADLCHQIHLGLEQLEEEWGVSPYFTMETYYNVLNSIVIFWPYFQSNYVADEYDEDVTDLIIGMKHL